MPSLFASRHTSCASYRQSWPASGEHTPAVSRERFRRNEDERAQALRDIPGLVARHGRVKAWLPPASSGLEIPLSRLRFAALSGT